MKIKKYLKIWWLMSKNSFLSMLMNRTGFALFLLGKVIRFGFFVAFLIFLLKGTDKIVGYDLNQTLFFFLSFNLIDTTAQFLFREVYRFRPQIIEGTFDLTLLKPINALFKSLMGGADIIDLITLPPFILALIMVGRHLNPSFWQVSLYLLLVLNGLLIATAFHILVISMSILTLEIDHSVMIYRDLTRLGRLPVDIYKEPLRGIISYLIPIGLMSTLPAKAMMGLVSVWGILIAFLVSFTLTFLSTRLWRYSLTKYSSASS